MIVVLAHRMKNQGQHEKRPMTPVELAALAEAMFGPRWVRPLSRLIGWHYRSVRCWKHARRSVPLDAADKIRGLAGIGPVGVIVSAAVKKTMPEADPWSAHRVAQQAIRDLVRAGLLDEQ
jgi:hypothetical protein